jgi:hypothetical protein
MRFRILSTLALLAVTLATATSAQAVQHLATPTPYVVSMTTPSGSMTLGGTMTVTGTVTGAGATKVVLQQRSGTTWTAWTTAKVVSGRYTLSYKPVAAGPHAVRAYVSGTAYHTYGVSSAKTITVYKWNYLSSFANTTRLVASANFWQRDAVVDINGQTFIHSLEDYGYGVGSTGYLEYNLSRACLTFRMTAGLTDESSSDGSAQLEVQTDGVQSWARTMSLGQSVNVSTSIKGGLRLRVADTVVTQPTGGINLLPAFGDARILCSF